MSIYHISCRLYQRIFQIGIKLLPWKLPKRIDGVDSFKSIPEILEKNQCKKPLIVTGPRVVKTDFFYALEQELEGDYACFCHVAPDPTASQVEEIAKYYQDNQCDSIVAVGGGSNMDAAKAAAAKIARPEKSIDDLCGLMKVKRKTPFFIAVPTTAGTGSETTIAAVIKQDKTSRKLAITDPGLLPDVAILDPNVTVSLTPELTAACGMDALTHAVEAYCNLYYHSKQTKRDCEVAVEKIFEFLPRAYEDGGDLEAREEMLIASFYAGAAFTRACVGNVHALAHTVGGLYQVPHGVANGTILPIVLKDYGKKVEEPLAQLAHLCGCPKDVTTAEASQWFIQQIIELNKKMKLPTNFLQIRKKDIPKMAKWACKEANPLYPVPVIYSPKDMERLLYVIRGEESSLS